MVTEKGRMSKGMPKGIMLKGTRKRGRKSPKYSRNKRVDVDHAR